MIPQKDHTQSALVCAHIAADDADVPVTAAAAHQFQHPVCRRLSLRLDGIGVARRYTPGEVFLSGQLALKQAVAKVQQRVRAAIQRLNVNFHAGMLGAAKQLRRRIGGFLKSEGIGVQAVTGKTHRHHRAFLNQMLQNRQMLPGEIRETIYVENAPGSKIILLQLIQAPGHLIPGIPEPLGAEGIVALQDQGEFFQLLRQRPFRAQGCFFQILRRNAAPLELIHRIHKLFQKLRFCLHRSIGLQTAVERTGGRRHCDDPSAVIHAPNGAVACPVCYPGSQARKRKHLCKTADRIPCRFAKPTLRVVADQLWHHQNTARLFLRHILRDAGKYFISASDPVCT